MTEADPRLALVFDEARRAITQQLAHVASLRERAGMLLGTAAVAASFFVAFSTRGTEQPSALTWAGVGVFAAVTAVLSAVVHPASFVFENDAGVLLTEYVDRGDTIDGMHRALAEHLAGHYASNKHVLDRLIRLYQLAIAGLAVEIVTFVLDMRGRG